MSEADLEALGVLPTPEADGPDLSWMKIALCRGGNGYIVDTSPGFRDCELLDGTDVDDNGVIMPDTEVLDGPGLYMVTNIAIRTYNDDEVEITGRTWVRLA